MCGRYYVDDDTAKEIEKLVIELDQKIKARKLSAPSSQLTLNENGREIFPTNQAIILQKRIKTPQLSMDSDAKSYVETAQAIWGFKQWKGNGVIINCRAETAAEKPTFRSCLQQGRCVIPASGFFEWDKQKQKWYFRNEEERMIYMAGLYQETANEKRFVILTTAANSSMQEVHDRMPVILAETELLTWLLEAQAYAQFLYRIPPMLGRCSC